MNLREFVARCEAEDFDNPSESDLSWAKRVFETNIGDEIHCGDCLKMCCSCPLCWLSSTIDDFLEYTKDPKKWRKENL